MVLELLDTMETMSTLMPKFLLPPQSALVLLRAKHVRDSHPRRVPAGSQEQDLKAGTSPDPTQLTARRLAACSPRAHAVPHQSRAPWPWFREAQPVTLPRRWRVEGWQRHTAPLHQAAVRGNFCCQLPLCGLILTTVSLQSVSKT